jgi:hypothetical protein
MEENTVYLKRAEESGTWLCSLCQEPFHISMVGPMKHVSTFREHVNQQHPEATPIKMDYSKPLTAKQK